MAHDLASLIAPIETGRFLDEYWERRPLRIQRGNPGYYSDLLTMNDVDDLLALRDWRHPSIFLAKDGKDMDPGAYTPDRSYGTSFFQNAVDIDRVIGHYQQGATIIIKQLQRSWKPLATLCRNMEKLFHHRFQANMYLSPKDAQGFPIHYDTHDVLVIQVEGRKHWRLYDAPVHLPHASQFWDASQTSPGSISDEFDLCPGDAVYIPRGFFHEAATSSTHSLHISLGFINYTWVDIFSQLADMCKNDVRFRKSLPVEWMTGSEAASEMSGYFQELVGILGNPAIFDAVKGRLAGNFVSERLPVSDGYLATLTMMDGLNISSRLRHRDHIIYRFVPGREDLRLEYHGKTLSFPRRIEQQVRFILDAQAFYLHEIPGNLDDNGKIVLARHLVKEGFLDIVPPN